MALGHSELTMPWFDESVLMVHIMVGGQISIMDVWLSKGLAIITHTMRRRQAIFWTNDGVFLIEPLGTNFNDISIVIRTFSNRRLRNGGHFVSASMC